MINNDRISVPQQDQDADPVINEEDSFFNVVPNNDITLLNTQIDRPQYEHQSCDSADELLNEDATHLSRDVDSYHRKQSDSFRARSVSSNPYYSLEEEQEFEDKEKFKITHDDHLIVASFKLPIDVLKDHKTGIFNVQEGPVKLSLTHLQYRACCIQHYIDLERSSLSNYHGLDGLAILLRI